jgi:hypothetical protein
VEGTKHINTININEMIDMTKQSIENPEKFISENKKMLEYYLTFMQSDEYNNSPMFQMQSLMIEFNKTNGYYDIFILLQSNYGSYRQAIISYVQLISSNCL